MSSPSFDDAFQSIGKLVRAFQANENYFLSASYQEAEVRKDFIDKFFIGLGWDVNHERQPNPYEQEVKVERGVAVGMAKRRADYAFHLAPNFRDPRFLVEAKKPSRDLANADDYFQAIRYGWTKSNPLAGLTDFEELHIVDCRFKPDIATALDRELKKFHYLEYADREKFAEIYWLLSREAVAGGSLEKFAAALPKPRGKAKTRVPAGRALAIDESFLADLDGYRQILAKGFKKENPDLDSETLTEITQRTLDRLVFMRFFEDKLIVPAHFVNAFGERESPWQDFVAASRRLDGIYNGVIFKRHSVLDRDDFIVDDDAFPDVCRQLSHEHSPYDFNSIPIHILGSIYERFLGNVIVATDKRVRVEQKPEVRKAGGVYYTPDYIVQYIAANTVGKLIEGKTPAEIADLRFADIACGSGSFLLDVYDLLLRYHAKWYNDHPAKAKKGDCVSRDGVLTLSLEKKRQILLNNIFGVDIDPQAVEVTQLSLYLKLLEEETIKSTHDYQLELHTTILPSLDKNIVCGNSLIGRDILSGQLFTTDEEKKLNPMNFEDAFPEVMRRGGFDAVVGNPPYGATLDENAKAYFNERYVCQNYQLDSYLLFLERSVSKLLKPDGYFGMIIPNPWLTNLLQENTRKYVTENSRIVEIVHFRFPVFAQATVDTQIVLLKARSADDWVTQVTIADSIEAFTQTANGVGLKRLSHKQDKWRALAGGVINIFTSDFEEFLAKKCLDRGVPLSTLGAINVGIKPYQMGKGRPPQTEKTVKTRPFDSDRPLNKKYRAYLRGADIGRYSIHPLAQRFLKYGPWLAEPRPAANFDAPVKIVLRQTGDSLVATIDRHRYLCLNNMHVIVPSSGPLSPSYILGTVNSRLLNWYYHTLNPEVGEALAEVKKANVSRLPIRPINFADPADKARHDRMVSLVEQMLEAKKHLSATKTDKDRNFYERKCEHLDRQIDALVYELYGLTEEEIGIVEGRVRK